MEKIAIRHPKDVVYLLRDLPGLPSGESEFKQDMPATVESVFPDGGCLIRTNEGTTLRFAPDFYFYMKDGKHLKLPYEGSMGIDDYLSGPPLDAESLRGPHHSTFFAIVRKRGMVVIPKNMRMGLGIEEGTVLEIAVLDKKAGWEHGSQ